jgi:hypothetical protein
VSRSKSKSVEEQRAYWRAQRAKHPETHKRAMKVYREKYPERCRSQKGMKFLPGQTVADMRENQNGCCAICDRELSEKGKNLNVDHCHDTGYVRSLLCFKCNLLLGQARSCPTVLRRAAEYLEHHKARIDELVKATSTETESSPR